jgi:uncharacterized protein (DUF2236 family)
MTEAVNAPPLARDQVRPEVIAEFRKHTGSALGGFFGAAAFDEVALVPVAAAVDKTGRFAANFADRVVRSGFSSFLAIWGDPVDRAAEGERLKRLHKEVRGRGNGDFADVRYNALDPDYGTGSRSAACSSCSTRSRPARGSP